jgi:LmbE family N-acetylglucosaminyl deacetylase
MAKRVLIIVAHADDMEFMAGGTIAKMAGLGYEIREVIATNNERGTLDADWSTRFTADTRREEARAGAKVLGVNPEIEFLGYEDGASVTPSMAAGACMRAIRRHRPDVLFTWDPHAPYEEHQDHRSVAWAATEAAAFSHFPLYHPEHRDEGLQPHYVGERYFFAKSPRDVNKVVDISDHIGRKIDALCAHVCQMEMTVLTPGGVGVGPQTTAAARTKTSARDRGADQAWASSVGRREVSAGESSAASASNERLGKPDRSELPTTWGDGGGQLVL